MKTYTRDDTEHGVEYVERREAEAEIEALRLKLDQTGVRGAFSSGKSHDAGVIRRRRIARESTR